MYYQSAGLSRTARLWPAWVYLNSLTFNPGLAESVGNGVGNPAPAKAGGKERLASRGGMRPTVSQIAAQPWGYVQVQ